METRRLTDRDIKILQLIKDHKMNAIAKMFNLSSSRVQQIRENAKRRLEKLKSKSLYEFQDYIERNGLTHIYKDYIRIEAVKPDTNVDLIRESKKEIKLVAKYNIVTAPDVCMLTERVQEFINYDWQIFGAPFVHGADVCQCIFKNAAQEVDISAQKKTLTDFAASLIKRIEDFEFTMRTHNCLRGENIIYWGDLICKTEAELLQVPNLGPKSLTEIKDILQINGLSLNTKLVGWPPKNLDDHPMNIKGLRT